MEVMDAIEKRYSVREYADIEIEKDKLDKIMEAGRLAPTASNQQLNKHIIVTDKDIIRSLVDACEGQQWIATAPAVIVECASGDRTMICGQSARSFIRKQDSMEIFDDASIDEVETLRKKYEALMVQLSEAEDKVRELNRMKVHECFAVTKLTEELLDEYVEKQETGIPYQTLINLYLVDCVKSKRKLEIAWK